MTPQTETVLNLLRERYPDAVCELDFGTPFQLLVAVILSAQCTDKRVNIVTPPLFERYPGPAEFAAADEGELKRLIHSCGFYNTKAKHIISAARDITERFGGRVPDTMADLMTLAGVGRKTANVVSAVAFKGQAIAVDTHVFRVSNRLGLARAGNVYDTEMQLRDAIDPALYSDAHHLLLFLGRYTCKSQRPLCGECVVKGFCEKYKNETQKSEN
ncbi:MAG: endonuclease III [Clostridiales bacterium]|jgi:endonuclease-3|nr:endonuclease III [Clostridiales bacterium]